MRNSIGYRIISRSSADPTPSPLRAAFRLPSIGIMLLLLAISAASAQTTTTIGNRFIRANVDVGSATGRFWITASPEFGSYRFLYGNAFFITSNLIFKVTTASGDHYFSNIPFDYPHRPSINGEEVPFVPYDDFYQSDDTLALTWSDLEGYTVTVRFIPEKGGSELERGGDMLIEFSYSFDPLAAPATLGIFMMLDSYNSQVGSVDGASSTLTADHYFNIGAGGKLYPAASDSIPEFYQVGDFHYDEALDMVLPVHRMKGLSHGGAALTAPHGFAVGDWSLLRDYAWDINPAEIESTPLGDVATILRWQGLQGEGVVRTAFGLNDREGNNMFHCHDSSIFFNVRTARLVEQKTAAGAYTPAAFDVDMWVANLNVNDSARVSLMLDSIAASDGLALDASTPAGQTLALPKSGVGRLRWRLFMRPGKQIARADVPLIFRYSLGAGEPRGFRELCSPTITVKGFRTPNEDSLPPVITLASSGSTPRPHWSYTAIDRHPGYPDDSGIDTVRLVTTRSRNVAIAPTAPINRCNVNATAELAAFVVDSLQPARLVFAVYDCRGNVAYDSASYTPVGTDTLPPVVERIDSSKGEWRLRIFDRHPGYIYDSGIDTIRVEIDRSVNFTITNSSFAQCDTSVTIQLTAGVRDTMSPGVIYFRVADCRGNFMRDSVLYIPPSTGVDNPEDVVTGGEPAIVEIRPQPLVASSNRTLVVVVKGLGHGDARCELVASDGHIAGRFELTGIDDGRELVVRLPGDLPAGAYIMRVIGGMGEASARVVVID